MARRPSKTSPQDATSVRDRAYTYIQEKIGNGQLAAGSSISELTIAKDLGISRTPIREAVAQLVAEGMLEELNRGVIVARLSRQDIIELYELREALEVFAVGKAASRALTGGADIKLLEGMIDGIATLEKELRKSGKKILDAAQMHRFVTHDLGFHRLLMRLALNGRILKVVNQTRLLIRVFAMHRNGYTVAELERIRGEHTEILQLLVKQDASGAMRALSRHIQVSCRERLDTYDQWDREISLRETFPASTERRIS